MERGAFVRASLGTAAGLAATAFAVILFAAAPVQVAPSDHEYWGARVLPPGPASDGLPIVGVRVASDGTIAGIPSNLQWYAYNGRETSPGLSDDFEGDNTFRYAMRDEQLQHLRARNLSFWWEPFLGQPVRSSDFPPQAWEAAPAVWRSPDGAQDPQLIRVWVMRVDPSSYPEEVRSEFVDEGFLAFVAHDTHFGCLVGWRVSQSPLAVHEGKSVLMDTCHQSRYDPREILRYELPPAERDTP